MRSQTYAFSSALDHQLNSSIDLGKGEVIGVELEMDFVPRAKL
jgi:hypothetical protein